MGLGTRLQETTARLLERVGNSCVLSKVTVANYDPAVGKKSKIEERIGTFCTSAKNSSLVLSTGNPINFNLSGFSENKLLVPYIKGYVIDDTWLFDGDPIETVEKIEAQDVLIAYMITVKG